ncbi:N-6 DNA methylase [Patescibacteria group bacterium]|nr:N-6 DNA methylase [Patescibacteria group bacterium]
MDNLTTPLESATRKEIDRILENLEWDTHEFEKKCNVFTERVRTKEEEKKIRTRFPKGRFPDYVLYSSDKLEPLAVIEAKRVGVKLEKALTQAKEYAECIGAQIIFAVDGAIVEARWVDGSKYLKNDGQLVTELLSERLLRKFVEQGNEITSSRKTVKTKEDLIRVFARANDLLRQEGMREGIERFTEFSNILFLKLIDEIEDDRERRGEPRRVERNYCWLAFYKKPAREMLDYINGVILPKLVDKYNGSGDVFSKELAIKNPNILKQIVDALSELTLLDVDSDVKGDAFEYFLKNSVTVGNDLGEYYTPRHIVKLMVDLVDPKFGDKVYDPCCGTGGFLIEAFRHIKRNCSPTKANLALLERDTIYGGELTGTAKIAKMNMIIAGDGHTHITQQDSLANPVKEKFETVLTNFPFSQKTEVAHLYGLSAKSANSVFLKHVIDSLKPKGRAGVIVPDSVLFGKDMDMINVRRELIEKCEVKAVIQLSVHTFLPYTQQPTTILIFEKGGRTRDIWFFELTADGFRGVTKRRPTEENDIPLLRSLWSEKEKSSLSFIVNYDDISKEDYKLFLNYYKYKTRKKVRHSMELGQLCEEFIIGHTPDKKASHYYGEDFLWTTIADMKGKVILNTKIKLSKAGVDLMGERRKISKGELLMSFKLTLGKTAFAGKDLYTNEAICALSLKKEYDTEEVKEYLYHILPLIDYVPYAQRAAKGSTLNKDLLPTVGVPFPDANERKELIEKKDRLNRERTELEEKMKKNASDYTKFINSDIMGLG